MNDDAEHERPARLIWLYLLRAGEFQYRAEIREGLKDHYFARFDATLRGMREVGSVSVRETGGRSLRYGVTPTCRVPRGISVSEVMEAAAGQAE